MLPSARIFFSSIEDIDAGYYFNCGNGFADKDHYDAEDDFAAKIIDNGSAVKITKYVVKGRGREVRIPPMIYGLPVTVMTKGNLTTAWEASLLYVMG